MSVSNMIIDVSDTVRIQYLQVSPMVQNDIVVEELKQGEWVTLHSFNSLSNDYAYTSARDFAKRVAKK